MAVATPKAPRERRKNKPDLAELGSRWGVVIAWIVVVAFFSIVRPGDYFSWANFQSIFGSQAVLLILTLGLLVSLTAGEFDLSFAGVMSVSLVLVGYLNVLHHWPITLAVAGALTAGLIIGLFHAYVIVHLGVDSIVVTLGTGTLLAGISIGINTNTTAGISPALVDVALTQVLGLPLAFYYGLALTALVWYVFTYTPLGRYLYFVGASRDVARLSGLPVQRLRAWRAHRDQRHQRACWRPVCGDPRRIRSTNCHRFPAAHLRRRVPRVHDHRPRPLQRLGLVRGRLLPHQWDHWSGNSRLLRLGRERVLRRCARGRGNAVATFSAASGAPSGRPACPRRTGTVRSAAAPGHSAATRPRRVGRAQTRARP